MPATKIEVQVQNGLVHVRTPLNTYFVQRAKKLAGRWDPRSVAWVFDARIEDKVRALCVECYGNDGTTFQELVDIRVTYLTGVVACKGPATVFGRIIGSAKARHSGATLGNGVVLEMGKITSSGSHANWTAAVASGTVVILLDVPKALVLSGGPKFVEVNIIEPRQPNSMEQALALTSERDRLLARVAEIDSLLAATLTLAMLPSNAGHTAVS